MAQNKNDNRPISPHLQIYGWNISSLTSIIHRFTGVLLYLAIIAISWYVVLFTYKTGNQMPMEIEENCDCPMMMWLQYAICFISSGLILALYYHLCNGIRHLFWDIGKGYDIKIARKTGVIVILSALILTAATIGFIAYFKFL